jgi:hypothetical protein
MYISVDKWNWNKFSVSEVEDDQSSNFSIIGL